jgi:hypothetical protein
MSTVLPGHDADVTAVAFGQGRHQDPHWAITASLDGSVRLWTLDPEDLVDPACSAAGRNLDLETEWVKGLKKPDQPTCPNLGYKKEDDRDG